MGRKIDTVSEDFNTFISEISDMTDRNDHGGARELIAEFFDMKNYLVIFHAINVIHDLERSIPGEIFKYREQKTKEMLSWIGKNVGSEVADMIHDAL